MREIEIEIRKGDGPAQEHRRLALVDLFRDQGHLPERGFAHEVELPEQTSGDPGGPVSHELRLKPVDIRQLVSRGVEFEVVRIPLVLVHATTRTDKNPGCQYR